MKRKKRSSAKASSGKPSPVKPPASVKPQGVSHTTKAAPRRVRRSELRKHLDERLRSLHQRTIMIEKELRELDQDRFYRCCIFGSARIKPGSTAYQDVFELARFLAWDGIDILTGGGPGLMEAANKGAKLGQQEKASKSISVGLTIQLDFEPEANHHLDVKRHHQRFSSRLDDFMRLSNSIVVTPGGIGTLLELYFSWQLIQVRHIETRPVVLLDKEYWQGIIQWMREQPLDRGLVSAKDFDCISIVDTPEEAFERIAAHHKEFNLKKMNLKK
jgi:uncharacterized protein (TIGR00730 family)